MSENEKYTPPEVKKRIISLSDLVDTQRQLSREYASLIERQEQKLAQGSLAAIADDEYAERWSFLVSKSADEYLQKFQGSEDYEYVKQDYETLDQLFQRRLLNSLLIDLGSGHGFMESIAYKYKLGTYIQVDRNSRYLDEASLPPDPQVAIQDIVIGDLQRIRVKADMLDFLAHLRPNTINFTLNGIDLLIIDNVNYHNALAQEILRVAQNGSLIFGVDSHALELFSRHTDAENSELKECFVDELPEMSIGRGRVFEVVK